MNVIEQQNQARIDIRNILDSLGFKDGANLTHDEIEMEQGVIYWNEELEESLAKTKASYLVYTISSPSDFIDVDNYHLKGRINFIINLLTTLPQESKKTYDLLYKIENGFISAGWRVKVENNFYDTKAKLHQYTFTIGKLYG